MKLHAVQRKFSMLQPHNFAVVRFSRNFEGIRERFAPHDQRVLTRRLERLSDVLENVSLIVTNRRSFPVH